MNSMTTYIRKNWFKIAIAVLLLYIATKKDLSFNINMNTPAHSEEPAVKPPASPVSTAKQREQYTQKDVPLTANTRANHFEIQPFSLGNNSTGGNALNNINEEKIKAFVKRFVRVAVNEKGKFGIPPSITLGHALLMSQAGESLIATNGNNFFQLMCTADWRGATTPLNGQCYRNYETAWMSFRDHSLFITTGKFSPTRQMRQQDYLAWIAALQKIGFYNKASDAKAVAEVIEYYKLTDWDKR